MGELQRLHQRQHRQRNAASNSDRLSGKEMNMERVLVARPNAVAAAVIYGCLIALAPSLPADTVSMKDGRQFEGNIVRETDADVNIDTVVAGLRATLKLSKSDVDKIQRKPVDDSFFKNRTSPPPPKLSRKFPDGAELYLEVPIVGRIGEQVVPSGLSRCLSYASGNGIRHVVFVVDSQGGDVDATAQMAKTLRQYEKTLSYHSIVRDGVGLSMLFPIYSSTVHLKPGATLGGVAIIFDPKKLKDTTEGIMKSQIARNASAIAERHGLPSQLIPPMIDPATMLMAWRDPSGAIRVGAKAPAGTPAQNIIFDSRQKSELLILSHDDAVAAGFGAAFDGASKDLGQALKLSNWTSVGDYGYETMRKACEEAYKARNLAAAKFEKRVASVTERREQVAAYIDRNIEDARRWNPIGAVDTSGGNGDHNSKVISTGGQTNAFTDRADMALGALKRALQGVNEMEQLESQAVKLGLEPMYKPGELGSKRTTIQSSGTFLQRERDRQSRVVSY